MGVQIQTLQAKVKMNLMYFALFFILAVTVKSGPNPRAKANAEAKPKAIPNPRFHPNAPYPPIQRFPPITRPIRPYVQYCGSPSLPCHMCAEWICAQKGFCTWDYHSSQCYSMYSLFLRMFVVINVS